MQTASQPRTFSASDVAALSLEKIAKLVNDQSSENAQLRHQLEWFKRQIFGQKSERRLAVSTESQSSLGEEFAAKPPQAAGKQTRVGEHVRVAKPKDESVNDESSLFFDESKVPVETINLRQALKAPSHRLAPEAQNQLQLQRYQPQVFA